MAIDDGGLAFPRPSWASHSDDIPDRDRGFECGSAGMTLRDYFAAKAMSGMLANPHVGEEDDFHEVGVHRLAISAYTVADAMLKQRAKP